jgi:gamma-glutamyl phosphate reductase
LVSSACSQQPLIFDQPTHTKAMNQAALMKTGIALGIVFAVYKFVPNQAVKAAALGVGGIIVAKQVPYVRDAV